MCDPQIPQNGTGMSKQLSKESYEWPEAYEKVFIVTSYQGNGNQNNNKISIHSSVKWTEIKIGRNQY